MSDDRLDHALTALRDGLRRALIREVDDGFNARVIAALSESPSRAAGFSELARPALCGMAVAMAVTFFVLTVARRLPVASVPIEGQTTLRGRLVALPARTLDGEDSTDQLIAVLAAVRLQSALQVRTRGGALGARANPGG